LAVKKDGIMIGELVLHNFDYFGGVEMGFRFFKDYQGQGYATESAGAIKEFAFSVLGAKKVKSRCYKENLPSKKLIERLGLIKSDEDGTHYYFAIDSE
jgi:RimJ/RimL family protein N-acetyltransferase